MRHLALGILVAGGGLLGAVEDRASGYLVRLQAGVWLATQSAQVGYLDDAGSASLDANELDGDTADLDDLRASPMVSASVRLPAIPIDLHAGLFSFAADGKGRLGSTVRFGDRDFTAGTEVEADTSFLDGYVEGAFRVVPWAVAGVSAGLAVHALTVEAGLEDGAGRESFDEAVYFPTLALRGWVHPIPSLGIEATLHLLKLEIGDVEATYVDLCAQAVYRPWERFGFAGGLRLLDCQLEWDLTGDDQARADVSLFGPFVAVIAQW